MTSGDVLTKVTVSAYYGRIPLVATVLAAINLVSTLSDQLQWNVGMELWTLENLSKCVVEISDTGCSIFPLMAI